MRSSAAACWSALLLAAFLAGLGPAVGMPEALLDGLGADGFEERERAATKLAEWAAEHADQAVEKLFIESVENEDPEVRMRCREVLREVVLERFRQQGQGYVGIQMGQIDVPLDGGKTFGVRVMAVVEDTPAKKAGLQVNDVIVSLDGKTWQRQGAGAEFQAEVKDRLPGELVRLEVKRAGEDEVIAMEVKLGRRPLVADRLFFRGRQDDLQRLQSDEENLHFKQWYDRRLRRFKAGER